MSAVLDDHVLAAAPQGERAQAGGLGRLQPCHGGDDTGRLDGLHPDPAGVGAGPVGKLVQLLDMAAHDPGNAGEVTEFLTEKLVGISVITICSKAKAILYFAYPVREDYHDPR